MKIIENFIPKKILVLQQRQLGDVIVTTPVFSVLRKKFPHAHIALFTENKCLPLVLHDPNIDSFEILDKSKKSIFEQWKTYFQIRKNKYDIVIDLQQLPRCQLATLFSGAKYKITFFPRHSYRKILYTHYSVKENFEDYISYTKTRFLDVLGVPASHEKPKLYLKDEEKARAKEILEKIGLSENSKFITLDATHKHPKRRWKYYKELITHILNSYPEMKIFLFRAPEEDEQLKALLNLDKDRVCMPEKCPNLRESMACMSFASFHIGNTSAPAHMALALDIPALIILSHTAPLWHFNPKLPEKGMPKQLEARVEPEILKAYFDKESITKENFEKLEYPEIDLISAEEAFKKFEELVKSPYYS